jgi:hypoxanthine phosphoribosyltransferase
MEEGIVDTGQTLKVLRCFLEKPWADAEVHKKKSPGFSDKRYNEKTITTKHIMTKCLKNRTCNNKRYNGKTNNVTKRTRTKHLKRHKV